MPWALAPLIIPQHTISITLYLSGELVVCVITTEVNSQIIPLTGLKTQRSEWDQFFCFGRGLPRRHTVFCHMLCLCLLKAATC